MSTLDPAASFRRDQAIERLCERATELVERELQRDDERALTFLAVELVRETLDDHIRNAEQMKVNLAGRQSGATTLTTRLVHLDGGIDALQEVREKLLGERLGVRE